MSAYRQGIGRWGEQLAQEYLVKLGYQVVACNLRTPYGEIDIIAREGNTLVFVEVKTRTTGDFGAPEASVTPQKQAHLLASAQLYLQEHLEIDGDWRVDVIAISGSPRQPNPEITHFENAIS